jgi:GDP/UDP-N,N'-diacetylbacillosamine 2-epimerase (hydrolysing)
MVKIGVLTSSRADYGVYLPLLRAMKSSGKFKLRLIAFGTHTSKFHGYTLTEIRDSGDFEIDKIESLITSDTEGAIATSSALTSLKFADYWENNAASFDWVLCLGDRFEMAAAVFSGIPYGIRFAHFYGGDYSPGAIDNVYRNCLTHCSELHFTSTEICAQRVRNMVPVNQQVKVVGIMSLEKQLNKNQILSKAQIFDKWNIPFSRPTILATFHPETINPESNNLSVHEVKKALSSLVSNFDIVVTMPNSDTNGVIYRHMYTELKTEFPKSIFLIENFGIQSYFSCMYHAILVLGNSSSGITEAASFSKYTVNVGDRQKGRAFSENIISVDFDSSKIIDAVKKTATLGTYTGQNIYSRPNAINEVISNLLNA